MSDGKHGKNPLDQLQDELAAATGREAPEYNIIAMTASGRMLGAVTLAPGLCSSLDDACDAVQGFFRSRLGAPGAVNVRPITQAEGAEAAARIRGRIGKPQMPEPNVDLGQILIDVKNATDCCVLTIGAHCDSRPEIKPESEVSCSGCGSWYRYTNDGEGSYAWLWMLPKKYIKSEREIFTLEQAVRSAKERAVLRDREKRLVKKFVPPESDPSTDASTDPVTGEAYKSTTFAPPPSMVRIYAGSENGDMPKMSSRLRETLD